MRVVRGRADARWLPSRFRYSLFRVFAYMRMRAAKPELRDVSLMIDPDQNNLESHLVGIWATLTLACFAVGSLLASWPLPLAIPVAILIAITCLEIPIVIVGLLRKRENNIGLNSVLLMSLLIAAALYFARAQQLWMRIAAWQFLGGVTLNALAAPFAFLLRDSIAKMENAVGGITSEL